MVRTVAASGSLSILNFEHCPARRLTRATLLASAALVSVLLPLPHAAQAQVNTWGGTGSLTTTNDYNLGTNWSNPPAGAPPVAAGQSAIFANTGSATVTVTAGPIAPDSWTFNANAQSYTISGANVNFSLAGPTGGIINNANAGQTITISNNIGESVAGVTVQQLGNSTLVLSGTNTYTGGTTIGAGATLTLGTGGSIVGSVTNSGTFNINSGATYNLNGSLSSGGAGSVTDLNGGTLRASSTSTVSDTVSFAAGTTSTLAAASGQTLTLTGALVVNTSTAIKFGSATDTGVVVLSPATGTVNGVGTQTYEVVGGTWRAGNSIGIGFFTENGLSTKVDAGATLDLNGFNAVVNTLLGAGTVATGGATLGLAGTSNFSGAITGTGSLNVSPGTQTLTGTNTYTGATTINGGTLALTGTGSIATSSQVNVANAAGTFDISGTTAGATITTLNGVANSHVTLGAQTLTISNGSTTYAGIIQGTGGLTLSAGTETLSGTNTYTGATTISGGTLFVAPTGSITSNVTNFATFSNSGAVTGGAGVNNAATFNNNAGGTVSGLLTNTAGTTTNAGQLNGGASITGGVLTTTGSINGLSNSSIVNANGGTINNGITNNSGGTFNVGGAVTTNSTFTNNSSALLAVGGNSITVTTLANAGTTTLANGTIVAGNTQNSGTIVASGNSAITGTVSNQGSGAIIISNTSSKLTTTTFNGGGAANIQINLSTAAGAAGNVVSTNNSGSIVLNFSKVGGPTVLGPVTPVIVNSGAGTLSATATGLPSGPGAGLVTAQLVSTGSGNWGVEKLANTGAIGAPAGSIMAAISAFDTSFHQVSSAFVASPQSQDPNKWSGGMWSRVAAGQVTAKSTVSDSIGSPTTALQVKTNFDAYQVGLDSGLLNTGNSGWNAHFGVMAGSVSANSTEQLGSGTTVKFDVPFAGLYGVFTYGSFFSDVTVRHDWHHDNVTNAVANLNNADLSGHTDAVTASAGYRIDLPKGLFVEPSIGFGLSKTSFDALPTNLNQLGIAPGLIGFNAITSETGRVGVRIGGSANLMNVVAVQPFVTGSVWREFAATMQEQFSQTGTTTVDNLGVDRVGTFYQVGAGVGAQVLKTGLLSFVRTDVRFGERLDGASIVGGARYTFAP